MLLNNKYEYNPQTDLLGVGGFGRVYKARDTLLDKDVALKMVNIEGAKAQYSLVAEIKKVFDLSHKNIIRYFDIFELITLTATGEEIKTQVGVMEYIPHGDISQLDWLSLSAEQQKDILLQILDGLHYLHQNRIIHRDIKPANILIKKEGNRIIPKITDFGISKAQDAESVSLSRVIGSIPYMAPEQFDSKGRVGYNTDFWSLGILVYRLFTGSLPFGDESTTSEGVIMKNIMQMPVPLEVKKIPQPFLTLVEHCLVKERVERIKDARVLKEILNHQVTKQDKRPTSLTVPINSIKQSQDGVSQQQTLEGSTIQDMKLAQNLTIKENENAKAEMMVRQTRIFTFFNKHITRNNLKWWIIMIWVTGMSFFIFLLDPPYFTTGLNSLFIIGLSGFLLASLLISRLIRSKI